MDVKKAFDLSGIAVQAVNDPVLAEYGVKLSILRADLVHPVISGNKWFKLKYNLISAKQQGYSTLLSFGGAWSNHLHALAEAGRQYNFRTIGIIRGELPTPLNDCLADAELAGMQLESVDRATFRLKNNPDFIQSLKERYGDFYLIPEGGANREGIEGCAELVNYLDQQQFDLLSMACGTGTMLTGILSASDIPVLGFQVLKGSNYLQSEVERALVNHKIKPECCWSINDDFHFGGYARTTAQLQAFISRFNAMHNIPLEPVYSGKMLFGLYELIKKRDYFPQNSRILAIHGGGLQGNRGFL